MRTGRHQWWPCRVKEKVTLEVQHDFRVLFSPPRVIISRADLLLSTCDLSEALGLAPPHDIQLWHLGSAAVPSCSLSDVHVVQ